MIDVKNRIAHLQSLVFKGTQDVLAISSCGFSSNPLAVSVSQVSQVLLAKTVILLKGPSRDDPPAANPASAKQAEPVAVFLQRAS